MTIKTCIYCAGSGYDTNNPNGELNGNCLWCGGSGIWESHSPTRRVLVEVSIDVEQDAIFTDSVAGAVSSLLWGASDEFPTQNEYIVQLFHEFVSELSKDGIHLKSISVGTEVSDKTSLVVANSNKEISQPSLFD